MIAVTPDSDRIRASSSSPAWSIRLTLWKGPGMMEETDRDRAWSFLVTHTQYGRSGGQSRLEVRPCHDTTRTQQQFDLREYDTIPTMTKALP